MKRKIIQKITIAALAGILSFGGAAPVSASSILDVVSSAETSENYSKDIQYSLLRGNHLNYGMSDIGVISSNEVNITGRTQCHHICDKVYLNIYLEQKKDGSYYTYKMWKLSKENATNLTRSMNVIVPSGYYYRVRSSHAAEDGSYESLTSLTDGVWVG